MPSVSLIEDSFRYEYGQSMEFYRIYHNYVCRENSFMHAFLLCVERREMAWQNGTERERNKESEQYFFFAICHMQNNLLKN